MAYFPFMVELKEREIYIIGGGKSAWQKIRSLRRFDANLTVVSGTVCQEILQVIRETADLESVKNGNPNGNPSGLAADSLTGGFPGGETVPCGNGNNGSSASGETAGRIRWIPKSFDPDGMAAMFDDADIVIAATDDRTMNRRIAVLARERRIPVNTVDDRDSCDFIFPAVIRKEHYSVAVCTDGKSPLMARRIREGLEKQLPEVYDDAVEQLGEVRQEILRRGRDQKERETLLEEIAERILRTEL